MNRSIKLTDINKKIIILLYNHGYFIFKFGCNLYSYSTVVDKDYYIPVRLTERYLHPCLMGRAQTVLNKETPITLDSGPVASRVFLLDSKWFWLQHIQKSVFYVVRTQRFA